VQQYVIDSNKCISFQTIENKEEIPKELKGKFDNWIFGCDICQDVCPWNKKFSVPTTVKDFYPLKKEITFDEVMNFNKTTFRETFSERPIERTKIKGLQRNAKFIFEAK
jgi:epoxyqueuosine reductase